MHWRTLVPSSPRWTGFELSAGVVQQCLGVPANHRDRNKRRVLFRNCLGPDPFPRFGRERTMKLRQIALGEESARPVLPAQTVSGKAWCIQKIVPRGFCGSKNPLLRNRQRATPVSRWPLARKQAYIASKRFNLLCFPPEAYLQPSEEDKPAQCQAAQF